MPPANNVDPQDTPTSTMPSSDNTQAEVQTNSASVAPAPGVVMPAAQPVRPSFRARLFSGGKKKLALLTAAGAVLLIGGAASAYYVGVVVPNKPENLWHTALERTAKGYDGLVAYAQENKDVKGTQLKGDYKLEGAFATDGTFEAQTYERTSTFKADIGLVGSRVNLEGRILPAANSNNPDVYIKASGLKGLATLQPEFAPIVEQYDNKWLSIDHTLFDNLESMALKENAQLDQSALTPEDFRKIAETVGKVNREYVFTTDDNKAILAVAKQVGKETKDDRSVYHYEVGLHKQHTKDYLNALIDSLENTPITKMTDGKKLRDTVDMNALLKSVDEYKESDVAHVYVDVKTRLIRTVRLESKTDSKSFVEFTQNYTGGDVIPLAVHLHSNTDNQQSTLSASFNLNKKNNSADGNLSFEAPTSESNSKTTKFSMKYAVTARNDKVEAQKPGDAASLYELLGPLMGQYMSSGSVRTGTLEDGDEI